MKQNQRSRYNGRYNNNPNSGRGTRPQTIFRNTSLESSGPCGKLHGTALQLFEKYQAAAKDALIQNDDVLAETCLQYADHYMHIQNMAIANEQAMRQQQTQASQRFTQQVVETVQEEETSEAPKTEEVELPDAQPTVAEEKNSLPSDGDLKVLDLSVPVADMMAKQKLTPKKTPVRRKRIPSSKE